MDNPYIERKDLTNLGYSEYPSDQILDDICLAASEIANNFCLQSLGRENNIETLTISRSGKLFISFLPVLVVNSISLVNGTNIIKTLDSSEYLISNRGGYIELPYYCGYQAKIDYDHGYDPIPSDIKRALISIGANLISDIKRRAQVNFENVSEIVDNKQKIKFFNDAYSEDIPQSAKSILMKYKRVR